MKKQEKSLGYIMFLWVIILIPLAISFIPLILPISNEELKYALTIILLIFVAIFCTVVISIDRRDKSRNAIYKLYIGTCRKFNRKTRQLTRVFLYIFMIYLFLGGICTAIDKNNDTAFFQLYIQTFPYIICLILFVYLAILLFQKIDFKNNLNQIIPIFISISFLLLAIFETEVIEADAFYSLLKIIVSATLFYISFMIRNSKSILFWLSISLGILFNPIVQIHLNDSDLWQKIDILTIIYFIVYILGKLKVKK